MRIKEGYSLRLIAGKNIIVPTGAQQKEFPGAIVLNKTGVLLWNRLLADVDEVDLQNELIKEYSNIKKEIIVDDVSHFVRTLIDCGIVEI